MRKLPQKIQENKWARATAIATCVIAIATVLLVIREFLALL